MAGEAQEKSWPLPKFYFKVEFESGIIASFQEVSGLDTQTQSIEYRHGNSPKFSTISMPKLEKLSEVTLKKGVFVGDVDFFTWLHKIKMNTIKRQTVSISLLDEGGNPTIFWSLNNAFPMKVEGTDFDSNNEAAIETLVLGHEGLTINKP